MYQKKEELVNPYQKTIEYKELVMMIRQFIGFPAVPGAKVSRQDLGLNEDYWVHLDIGGEGANTHVGIVSGFASSINVNAMEHQSTPERLPIPNLVLIENWMSNPSYPFADGFADYITMQNAPLTPKNIDEIARCLRPGGKVELWIDSQFADDIALLAKKLNSKAEYDVADEFQGSTGSVKVRIVSGIKYLSHNTLSFNSFFSSKTHLIPERLRILPPTSFSSEQYVAIQRQSDRLQSEFQSSWPFPDKKGKKEEANALEALLLKSMKMEPLAAVKQVEEEFPEFCQGKRSLQTEILLDTLRAEGPKYS